jgi:hypothetical protein
MDVRIITNLTRMLMLTPVAIDASVSDRCMAVAAVDEEIGGCGDFPQKEAGP